MLKKVLLKEDGGVVLLIFFCATMITVLGVTAYYVANTELTEATKKYETAKAFYLAEAGLQRAFVEMDSGVDDGWNDELAGSDGEQGTDDDGILSFGPQVDCYAANEDADGSDTDMNAPFLKYYLGHYDVAIEDARRLDEKSGPCTKVILQSTGVSTKNFEKRIDDASFPDPNFNGQSWMIDGNDTTPDGTPDGTPGSGAPILGIASNMSVTPVLSALKDNQLDQVKGVGYDETTDPITPSIEQIDLQVNLVETVDYLKGVADNTVVPGTHSQFTGEFGSPDDYQVTVCDGDLHLSGQIEGYGVLVVTGNLTVSGQGTWHGYIFCLEGATFTGGGQPFHLYGALLVGTTSADKTKAPFTISGQSDLYYSQQTVEQAQTDVVAAYFSYWSSGK